jgi:hypothetical protein
MNDMLEEVCRSLGVPPRVFRGVDHVQDQLLAQFQRLLDWREERMRENLGRAVVQPMLEKAMPELFFERWIKLSPRGWLMRRREKPVEITWRDSDGDVSNADRS